MRLRLFAVAAICLSAIAAHADTFQTFNLNASLTNGTASGTVNFDETTGVFAGGNVVATSNGTSYTFNNFNGSATYDTITFGYLADATGLTFQISIPGTSNKNYMGGQICSDSNISGCLVTGGVKGQYYYSGFFTNVANVATSGTLSVPVTATPEPSSLALLGTGVLGAFGVLRKRYSL